MAEIALTDAFVYASSYDFTTQTNTATVNPEVAQLDATTFNSGGWQESAAGLKSVNFSMSGFWDSVLDSLSFSTLESEQAFTVGAREVEGANGVAYMFRAQRSQYTQGGQVGELAPFSLTANGTDGTGVVRGRLVKSIGTVTATGQLGTGVQLGTVASNKFLHATLHTFTTPGTSITVQVQSDDNSGFTSPTTVATLGPITTTTGTWMTPVAGPITDGWFRFNVSAITGTWIVGGAIGIR